MKRFHINNIRLRNKLLIVYFISVFIPIILTNVLFYHVTIENVKEQKEHDLSLALEQISTEFLKNVDDAVGVSAVLYSDSMLFSFLERSYDTPVDFILAYNSYFRDINKYVPIYSSIQSIQVYTNNDSVIYAGGIYRIDEEIKNTNWYKTMDSTRGLYPLFTKTKGDSGGYNQFSVIRSLNSNQKNATEKLIKINLNPSIIVQTFKNATFHGEVYLLNDQGGIEYTTDRSINWIEESFPFSSISLPEDAIVLKSNYSLQYLNNWTIVGVASENEMIEEVIESRKFILYLAILNFVFPSVVIIYITSSLHLRLSNILRYVRKMGKQEFQQIDGVEYQDEIGVLTSEFNRMSRKIKDLIHDVYIADIQKKDLELQSKQAQLSALQSQINPHFLFNVLETIRMRSLLKKEEETAHMIQNMAKLLRNSFVWGKDWVKVKDEINLIRSFLEIQQYRFDDKMQYEIDVDESLYDYVIPNMILIPFVENASIHGIEALKYKGKIRVAIKRTDDDLVCTIEDNGVGMDNDRYKQLLLSLKENRIGESVGIINVYYRLKLYYQDKFDFKIESSRETGTFVQVKIPAVK